ncbi:hypothetical protein CLOM_g9071 [Closterium sp. NIES-68]|nr:hypothetical protein CLOM_g9071 [Closterium sp. NIES-68]
MSARCCRPAVRQSFSHRSSVRQSFSHRSSVRQRPSRCSPRVPLVLILAALLLASPYPDGPVRAAFARPTAWAIKSSSEANKAWLEANQPTSEANASSPPAKTTKSGAYKSSPGPNKSTSQANEWAFLFRTRWADNFRPVRVRVPLPKLIGGLEDKKNRLAKTERRYLGQATGPESIAWDPRGGGPYVSVSDGRILRRKADDSDWEAFTHASPHRTSALCDSRTPKLALEAKCGRPLGMAFHPTTGDLYFADAYYGLFKVSSAGGPATKLVDVVDGERMMMCNDLDIDAAANAVYFTDSSSRWARRDFLPLLLEGRKDGRLMKYDIGTGRTTVLVDKVAFANGVALSRDKKFVVFCETTYLR